MECYEAGYTPVNHYFASGTKWLAQAIPPDAIKMGVDTACDEKSINSCNNRVNMGVSECNLLNPSMFQP
jgi:hypothetical protein